MFRTDEKFQGIIVTLIPSANKAAALITRNVPKYSTQ